MPKVGQVNPKQVVAPALEVDGVRLAVNLYDLDRVEPLVRQMLLGGKMDLSNAVVTDRDRIDEAAVVFACDLLTAACVCDTLRSHDRVVKDYPTRVYVRRSTAWAKVPGHLHLAVVVKDRCVLNPEVFGAAATARAAGPAEPLRAERID